MIANWLLLQGPTVATHKIQLLVSKLDCKEEPAVIATYEDKPEDTACEEFPELMNSKKSIQNRNI